MARSVVTRDLSQLLYERGIILNTSIDDLLKENFGGKDFYSDMDKRQKKLQELEKDLDQAEDNLKGILKKIFFDDNSIIDDIIYHLNTGKELKDIEEILNINSGDLSLFLGEVADDYVTKYNTFKTEMIEDIKYIGKIGETIRGDEQYYTIGIDNGSRLRNVVLNSDQWYQLISKNEYFSLQRDASGQRVLATNRQWTGKMIQKLDPLTGKMINEKVYSKTRGITGGELAQGVLSIINPNESYTRKKALEALNADPITQEIWGALKASEIYTSKSLQIYHQTKDESILKEIFQSRKYEILNSGMWKEIYLEEDPLSRQNKINNIVYELQKQGFQMENIFGGARGDTMLHILNGERYISNQQKFFGSVGKKEGFQVIDMRGLNNALSFYKDQENIQNADVRAQEKIANTPEGESAIIEGGMLDYEDTTCGLFMEFFNSMTKGVTVEEV